MPLTFLSPSFDKIHRLKTTSLSEYYLIVSQIFQYLSLQIHADMTHPEKPETIGLPDTQMTFETNIVSAEESVN